MFALLNLFMAAAAPAIAGMYIWLNVTEMLYLLPGFLFVFGAFNWFAEKGLTKRAVIWLVVATIFSAMVIALTVFIVTTIATNATDNQIRGLAVLGFLGALYVLIKIRRMCPADDAE